MREHPERGTDAGISDGTDAAASAQAGVLRLTPHITPAEAIVVFRRKLPEAHAEASEVLHPFWWTVLSARTRGILGRSWKHPDFNAAVQGSPPRGQQLNVLVNAYSGKAFIADFDPRGAEVPAQEWADALEALDVPPQTGLLGAETAARASRSLVRTKVVKTVKLGMRIDIAEYAAPRGVLKPNWLVTGANDKYSATILVDGFDSSHYIVRVAKLV